MTKILSLVFLICLASCSTTKKMKDIKTTSIDSAVKTVSDSAGVKKSKSITKTETDGSWEKETTLFFDKEIDTANFDEGLIPIIDPYVYDDVIALPELREYNINSYWKKVNKPEKLRAMGLSKVVIKEKGQSKSISTIETNNLDTAFKKHTNDVDYKKQETSKVKTVKRTDRTFFYICLGIGLIALVAIWYYRKPIGFFLGIIKRKEDDNRRSV